MSAPDHLTIVIFGHKPPFQVHFVRNDEVFHQVQYNESPTWESIQHKLAGVALNSEEVSRIYLLIDGLPSFLIPLGEPVPDASGNNISHTSIPIAGMQLVHAEHKLFGVLIKEFPWLRPVHVGEVLLDIVDDKDMVVLYVGEEHVVISYLRLGKPVFLNGFHTADLTEGLYFLTAVIQQLELANDVQIKVLGEPTLVDGTIRLLKEFYPNVNVALAANQAYKLLITTCVKCA